MSERSSRTPRRSGPQRDTFSGVPIIIEANGQGGLSVAAADVHLKQVDHVLTFERLVYATSYASVRDRFTSCFALRLALKAWSAMISRSTAIRRPIAFASELRHPTVMS